jgi:tRNA(Ile)-lysidine synthase
MFTRFTEYITKNNLLLKDDKVLLTVSGGIDSMVMLHLFTRTSFEIGIAHCNFQLRGMESDEDETFVNRISADHAIPYFLKKFKTKEYAEELGISIQMAARDLRYQWFEEIRQANSYNYIALAHNKNDAIETFFINVTRGTGIKGLTGMKNKQDKIIRPLLFATRREIEEYCSKNNIRYREDSSNISTRYSRNKIRHNIIPEFEEINPGFYRTMSETMERLSEAEKIYSKTIEEKKKEVVFETGEKVLIDISKLNNLNPVATYLFEFLRPYQFPGQIIPDIVEALDGLSGKQFLSPTYRLIKDRDHLIITKRGKEEAGRYYIDDYTESLAHPISLLIKRKTRTSGFSIPTSPDIACIDYEKLNFPLILRKWQKGDYFQPFGMDNIKKISDYFIDIKLSLPEKENTWILTSGIKIVWIVGKRPDDRFKITDETKEILLIEYIKDL